MDVNLATGLAIAIARRTPVVLLDDPTAGLGTRALGRLHDCLRFMKGAGTAVVLATSDLFVAGRIADRIGILKTGRLVAERSREEFEGRRLADLYTDYIGYPTAGV
jgi:ABC-2 type transport system ATP-binding protein